MERLLAGVLEIEGEEEKFYTENYIDFYTTNDVLLLTLVHRKIL